MTLFADICVLAFGTALLATGALHRIRHPPRAIVRGTGLIVGLKDQILDLEYTVEKGQENFSVALFPPTPKRPYPSSLFPGCRVPIRHYEGPIPAPEVEIWDLPPDAQEWLVPRGHIALEATLISISSILLAVGGAAVVLGLLLVMHRQE